MSDRSTENTNMNNNQKTAPVFIGVFFYYFVFSAPVARYYALLFFSVTYWCNWCFLCFGRSLLCIAVFCVIHWCILSLLFVIVLHMLWLLVIDLRVIVDVYKLQASFLHVIVCHQAVKIQYHSDLGR